VKKPNLQTPCIDDHTTSAVINPNVLHPWQRYFTYKTMSVVERIFTKRASLWVILSKYNPYDSFMLSAEFWKIRVVSINIYKYSNGASVFPKNNFVLQCIIHTTILFIYLFIISAPCYKSEGRGFDSRWCRNFLSTISFRSHYGPGVHSASKRNEYQVYFLGVKAAGA